MFTIHLKSLECFSVSKQVMHTIPEEREHAVTRLHQHSDASEMKVRGWNNRRQKIVLGDSFIHCSSGTSKKLFWYQRLWQCHSLIKVKSFYPILDWVIDNPSQKGLGLLPPVCFCFYLYL